MSEQEYEAYKTSTTTLITNVAKTAINEGDLSEEGLQALISILDTGDFSQLASNDSYASLALSITLLEVNNQLLQRGAYSEDGILNERGWGIIEAIKDGLQNSIN